LSFAVGAASASVSRPSSILRDSIKCQVQIRPLI
jgi:hypothetical protein